MMVMMVMLVMMYSNYRNSANTDMNTLAKTNPNTNITTNHDGDSHNDHSHNNDKPISTLKLPTLSASHTSDGSVPELYNLCAKQNCDRPSDPKHPDPNILLLASCNKYGTLAASKLQAC